jgi:hypothetical protein
MNEDGADASGGNMDGTVGSSSTDGGDSHTVDAEEDASTENEEASTSTGGDNEVDGDSMDESDGENNNSEENNNSSFLGGGFGYNVTGLLTKAAAYSELTDLRVVRKLFERILNGQLVF